MQNNNADFGSCIFSGRRGARDLLAKPLQADTLRRALDTVLGRAAYEDASQLYSLAQPHFLVAAAVASTMNLKA